MIKLDSKKYEPMYDDNFPIWYKATNEDIENSLWVWEYDNDPFFELLTFEEVKAEFDGWTEEERKEYLQDDWDNPKYTIYIYMRDCMRNALSAVCGYKRRENKNE